MRKKLFTLLLAVAASVGTMFAEPVQIGDLYYNLDATNQTAEVTLQNSGEYSGDIVIPSSVTYNSVSYSVTSIGSAAFYECTSLTSVTIPNSVTSIGSLAFYGCTSLTGVMIPNSVTSIGSQAFSACTGLTSIEIPNNLIKIRDGVFQRCSSLTSITIPNSVTSIESRAFYGCTSLASVMIPNNVTSIGSQTFYNCSNLASITIPNGVTSIKSSTFKGCSSLTSIRIPVGVTDIGESAFEGCAQLSSVAIPDGVTYIEVYAFRNCSILSSVTLPSSLTTLGYGVFEGTALYANQLNWDNGVLYADTWVVDMKSNILPSTYSIKNGTIGVAMNAFLGCANLQTIYIPSTIRYINSQAFSNSIALSSVIFADKAPNEVGTIIENSAFLGCSLLSNVVLGKGVSVIGEYAFKNCYSLTSIDIPNSVTLIDDQAFYSCSSLASVTIGDDVTNISYSAFDKCTNLPVINNIRYADNFLVEATDKTLNSYTIKEDTKWIASNAFEQCTNITSISIPSSVISIGRYAFYKCNRLKNIFSLATVPPVIQNSTFSNIDADAVVYVPIFCRSLYNAADYWKRMSIQQYVDSQIVSHSTNVEILYNSELIASCGIAGKEQQYGNVLEYTGLEPNTEYSDIHVVLTSNTGETDTVNVSFTTPALELTTKESKAVSSTTALLFAETNISDVEISCGFEWKRNDAPADMDGTKVFCPVANGQMAGRLKGLRDNVYYKYRAFYQSEAGNMYYGEWKYIFTGDMTVEFDPILYTYEATVVRENEATVSGYAFAGSDEFTEQGFEYWAESRVGSANVPSHMPAALNDHYYAQASGIRMSVTLNNLDAGTVYKYRTYAKVGDQYYYGSEHTFTTTGDYEGETTPIEEVPSDDIQEVKARKILLDGQIFILRGDKVYNAQGALVK